MMPIINICYGTGCQFSANCMRSEFNQPEKPLGAWLRHYYPQTVGESCLDYDPLRTERPWGVGRDVEAND